VVGSDNAGLYRTQVERSGLGNRIRFEQPRAEVLRFYAAADLYVAPSLEDAFNLPIVEAMVCGLPVIASSQAGSSELIRDGETGFILNDPKDDSQLARLIRCVFEDEVLRLTIGEAASRYALASCGWDQNVDETRKFLETAFECLPKK
jgi:UDP-glucose:(heptosyl)LPS alpha-1,3-glucosyltransferase